MYDQDKVDDFIFRSENLAQSVDKDKAFEIIVHEIDNCEDRYLNEYITALNLSATTKFLTGLKTIFTAQQILELIGDIWLQAPI
jgi:hypothetical protein